MRMLIVVFENSEGKNHRWKFKNTNPNKSIDEIKALLEKMTKLNLFEKNGVKMPRRSLPKFQQGIKLTFRISKKV